MLSERSLVLVTTMADLYRLSVYRSNSPRLHGRPLPDKCWYRSIIYNGRPLPVKCWYRSNSPGDYSGRPLKCWYRSNSPGYYSGRPLPVSVAIDQIVVATTVADLYRISVGIDQIVLATTVADLYLSVWYRSNSPGYYSGRPLPDKVSIK